MSSTAILTSRRTRLSVDSPHVLPILVLVLLAFLANALAITGVTRGDPALFLSGLGQDLGGQLLGGAAGWLDPDIGYITQPLGQLSANDWLHGIIPWWNPFTGVGTPLAAEMQTSSFFLPFVLLLHFWSGWVWLRLVLQIMCGVFTYALLIELRLGRLAALVGAGLYALNGTFVLLPHAPIAPLPFLPLLLLGIEYARRAAARAAPMGWSLIVVAVAYSIYAGFPETAYFDGLLAAVWSVGAFLSLPRAAWLRLAGKLAAGSVIGIALALPLIVPFVLYLRLGYTGCCHSGSYAHAWLPRFTMAFQLFPYSFGPIGMAQGTVRGTAVYAPLAIFWGEVGGWLGLLPVLLAIMAVLNTLWAHVPHARLRWLLFAWAIVWLTRLYGLPWAITLVNLIPGVAATVAIRFAAPSIAFSIFVLAAFAFSDWRRGLVPSRRVLMIAAASTALIVACVLVVSAGALRSDARMPLFAAASVIISLAAAGFLLGVLKAASTPVRARLAAGVVLLEAALLIGVPQLADLRQGRLDLGGVVYLQAHQGLSRAYSLGPFGVNYPAAFGVAAINGSQLPMPLDWARYVNDRLDRYADPVVFTGSQPREMRGKPDQSEELRRNLASYEAVGVRHVLAPPGTNPFQPAIALAIATQNSGGVRLAAGESVEGTLPPGPAAGAVIGGATIVLGTYQGQSSGPLSLQLCLGAECAQGSADLGQATDNLPFAIPLHPLLKLPPAAKLHFKLVHGAGEPVMIWLGRAPAGSTASGARHLPRLAPILSLTLPAAGPPRVFANATMSIYRLPNPAPYFSAPDAPCRLLVQDRKAVRATCDAPAALVRRELFFPGWRARVNGAEVPLRRTASIFQSVALPKGSSDVRFFYRPPFTRLSVALALLAVLAWVGAAMRGVGGEPRSELMGRYPAVIRDDPFRRRYTPPPAPSRKGRGLMCAAPPLREGAGGRGR